MVLRHLYVRIWLAVVLAVAVLSLLVGWAWRLTAEPPLREVVVRNDQGEVIGNGVVRHSRPPERADGASDTEPPHPPLHPMLARGKFGEGPEFIVQMKDGTMMHLHMPRPPNSSRPPFGFFWTLGLVSVAVALAIYPIVRRLTKQLETLQRTVQHWGGGDLSVRAEAHGQDEVAALALGFNQAAQQIESLIRHREALLASQKSLLANASHELRSPLARIRMGVELLAPVGAAAGQPDSGAVARDEISRNIAELDQLIDEILLASRLDAKEADLGTVEGVDLVGLAAEECARTGALLEVGDSMPLVQGVAKLLRRVVRNLLENARRYGGNGAVTVRLAAEAGSALLQVRDNGPGVPEPLQQRIFEPFYRLPGASEREGGVGLGLALVRSIVLRHGGSVVCRNRDDGPGAVFEVRLPLAG